MDLFNYPKDNCVLVPTSIINTKLLEHCRILKQDQPLPPRGEGSSSDARVAPNREVEEKIVQFAC